MGRVLAILSLLTGVAAGCGGDTPTRPDRASEPIDPGRPATLPVFYDPNGNPNVTYVSMNTQLLTTFNGLTIERRYVEEYLWMAAVQRWEHKMTFALADKPFVGSHLPGKDISYTRLAIGVASPTIQTRAGPVLTTPATIPSLAFLPAAPQATKASTASVVPPLRFERSTSSSTFDARASAVDAFVASASASSRRLAELRKDFSETKDHNGRYVFTRRLGRVAVQIVFDSTLGGIVSESTSENDVVRAVTTFEYDGFDGLSTVSSKRTVVRNQQGKELSRVEARFSNLSVK
ncbi:MAG: hypothetical protein IT352_18400 [Gemmatimonadales bacterium]|nr:hypothetical protein [Gemmatimonadales bacterium]